MQDKLETLDPPDWEPLRGLARRIVDDAVDYTRDVRERAVWQNMPPEVRARFRSQKNRRFRPLPILLAASKPAIDTA